MKNLSFFKNINKIYFIGIGGVSLSALSFIMKSQGFKVGGSDIIKTEATEKLVKNNILVNYKQAAKNIENFRPDLVVYSGAIKEDNPELIYAKQRKILCLERSYFIKEILPFYKHVISISGSHGKSTTTCMIAEIFKLANLNPTIHVGADSINLNANFCVGDNNYFINEACEYRKSFLNFKSEVGVILNIEEDHPDCYKNYESIKQAFNNFSNICEKIVINKGYETEIKKENKITFGKNGNFSARNIKILKPNKIIFKVFKNNNFYGNFTLNIFGKYNILNALAAISVADYFNIDVKTIKEALKNFKGLKRRFESVKTNKIKGEVYFDYAHHPTEINKLLTEVKMFNKPIICVFQPHTYSRTQKYFNNFLNCFKANYETVFYKTYSAREKVIKGATSKDIYKNLSKDYNVSYFNSFNKVIKHLKKISKENCLVLFVGAGDIYNIKEKL